MSNDPRRRCCCGGCPCPGAACSHCGDCTPRAFLVSFDGITYSTGCYACGTFPAYGSLMLDLLATVNGMSFGLVQDAVDPCVWKYENTNCFNLYAFASGDCSDASHDTFSGIYVYLTKTGAATGTLEMRVGYGSTYVVLFWAEFAWADCGDVTAIVDADADYSCAGGPGGKPKLGYGGVAVAARCGITVDTEPPAYTMQASFRDIQVMMTCWPSVAPADGQYGKIAGGAALTGDVLDLDVEVVWDSWDNGNPANLTCAGEANDPDGQSLLCGHFFSDASCTTKIWSSDYIRLDVSMSSCAGALMEVLLSGPAGINYTFNQAALFYATMLLPSGWRTVEIPNALTAFQFAEAGCGWFPALPLGSTVCQAIGKNGTLTLTRTPA